AIEASKPAGVAEKKEEKAIAPTKAPQRQIDPVPDGIDLHGAKKLSPYLVTAGVPKAASDKVKKGISWLVSKQRKDGGWAEGSVARPGAFGGFAPGRPAFA